MEKKQMKIGIAGDTHGHIKAIRQLLAVVEPVDYWLHTGDYSQDARFLAAESGLPMLTVAGNCDKKEGRGNVDEFLVLEGQRIWLTHGNRYMKGYQVEELAWWARKLEVDIVVFGHTHVPLVKWFGHILLVNPGSLALPRSAEGPTYVILSLQEGHRPEAKIFSL